MAQHRRPSSGATLRVQTNPIGVISIHTRPGVVTVGRRWRCCTRRFSFGGQRVLRRNWLRASWSSSGISYGYAQHGPSWLPPG